MKLIKKLAMVLSVFGFCSAGGVFAKVADRQNVLSEYTLDKISSFITERIVLKDAEIDDAVDKITQIRINTMPNLLSHAKDYEQEACILESLYYMEIYERAANDSNRKDMREKMRLLMERNFACIDSRKKCEISEWLYQVAGDVTSYYMTRSISATLHYGFKVKSFYESAVEINPVSPEGNISLGNWYFFAPGIFGGSNKKAEKCYKNAEKGSVENEIDGEKFLAYEFLSQLYFELKKSSLHSEYFEKFRNLGIGTREVKIAEKYNNNGQSYYQYMRNKSSIDKELPESEKDDADKKKSNLKF